MWSYYGRKSKIIDKYPNPQFDIIIEPFAGTAVYSLHKDNWKKQVILIDKYDVIINLWHYLQQAKPDDILKLPELKYGDNLDNYNQLCKEEKYLIGFCINGGSANPKKKVQKYSTWNEKTKYYIASNLHKIKHWDIRLGDYDEFEDINYLTATWFIDPPYQYGGKYYKYQISDYNKLAEYCKSRKGQVIVCENTKANWLDFKPLIKM